MNTIAVDAMGGDSAPVEIVKGAIKAKENGVNVVLCGDCLLYTSPSPRDRTRSRMPSSA